MKSLFAIVLISVLVFACTKKASPAKEVVTTTEVVMPAQPVIVQEVIKPAASDAAYIAQGKNLYDGKCGRCHGLKNTADYTADRWDGIMRSMAPKAKLSEEETLQVTAYVKAFAKK